MVRGGVCILICISLMIRNVEHRFICLFAICVYSLMKCQSLCLTFLFLLAFLLLRFKSSLYMLDNSPLSDTSFQVFPPNLWLSDSLVIVFHIAEGL